MSEQAINHDSVITAILGAAGRSTLAFEEAATGNEPGTAFWFNDLVDARPGKERIQQYLLTASALTQIQVAEFHLRQELAEPVLSAERLLITKFDAGWTTLDGLGVAAMATGGLHAYAARKQWRWNTDEITDGLAARDADIAMIGSEAVPAYVVGHSVEGPERSRPKSVLIGSVTRGADQVVRWDHEIAQGCVGAPVFVAVPRGDGAVKLLCIGVVLPGPERNAIATFDVIRRAVRTLSAAAQKSRRPWQRR